MKTTFKLNKTIFKENDVRGKYPEEINEKVAFILGRTFALILKKIYKKDFKILIGYDLRKSSPYLAEFLIEGIISVLKNKTQIISIGETTTPLFYFSITKTKAEASVMITASHNPYNENGFLFYFKNGISLLAYKKWDKEILRIALKEYKKYKVKLKRKKKIEFLKQIPKVSFKKEYLDHLLNLLNLKRPLKFVLDDGGGSAGLVLNDFLDKAKRKNLEIILVKGKKYRFSNPLNEDQLDKLKKEVTKRKADGGAAFDSDADRVVFVDEMGRVIDFSQIFGFLVSNFYKENNKRKFLTTEFLNLRVQQKLIKQNIRLIFAPTGYGAFYLKMKKEKAFFGSEHTGHYYFKDFNYHDDGLLALIFVLNFLNCKKQKISQIMKNFSFNPSFWLSFKSDKEKSKIILKNLKKLAGRHLCSSLENLKIKGKNCLMIWRISGTSNLLRVYYEKLR